MSIIVWISIGVIFVGVWGVIIWEIYTAPLMSDNYDVKKGLNTKKEKKKSDKKPIDVPYNELGM